MVQRIMRSIRWRGMAVLIVSILLVHKILNLFPSRALPPKPNQQKELLAKRKVIKIGHIHVLVIEAKWLDDQVNAREQLLESIQKYLESMGIDNKTD